MFQNNSRREKVEECGWGRVGHRLMVAGASFRHMGVHYSDYFCVLCRSFTIQSFLKTHYVANCGSMVAGCTHEMSLGIKKRIFSQVSKTYLCPFFKSHFKNSDQTSHKCIPCSYIWKKCPATEFY